MTLKDLDEIEAQMDDTVPYYLPRLVRDFRALLTAHDIAEEGRLSALRHCARLERLLASQEAAPSGH